MSYPEYDFKSLAGDIIPLRTTLHDLWLTTHPRKSTRASLSPPVRLFGERYDTLDPKAKAYLSSALGKTFTYAFQGDRSKTVADILTAGPDRLACQGLPYSYAECIYNCFYRPPGVLASI